MLFYQIVFFLCFTKRNNGHSQNFQLKIKLKFITHLYRFNTKMLLTICSLTFSYLFMSCLICHFWAINAQFTLIFFLSFCACFVVQVTLKKTFKMCVLMFITWIYSNRNCMGIWNQSRFCRWSNVFYHDFGICFCQILCSLCNVKKNPSFDLLWVFFFSSQSLSVLVVCFYYDSKIVQFLMSRKKFEKK